MSDFDKGYRAGVMAERKRAMLVALRAVNRRGNPSEEGHSLAHQIGRAGDMLPSEDDDGSEWSVFGERRLIKDTPTFLEKTENPFTRLGLSYIERLEKKLRDTELHIKKTDPGYRLTPVKREWYD